MHHVCGKGARPAADLHGASRGCMMRRPDAQGKGNSPHHALRCSLRLLRHRALRWALMDFLQHDKAGSGGSSPCSCMLSARPEPCMAGVCACGGDPQPHCMRLTASRKAVTAPVHANQSMPEDWVGCCLRAHRSPTPHPAHFSASCTKLCVLCTLFQQVTAPTATSPLAVPMGVLRISTLSLTCSSTHWTAAEMLLR